MLVSFIAFQRELTDDAFNSLITNAITMGEMDPEEAGRGMSDVVIHVEDEENDNGRSKESGNRWFPSFFSPWSPKKVYRCLMVFNFQRASHQRLPREMHPSPRGKVQEN